MPQGGGSYHNEICSTHGSLAIRSLISECLAQLNGVGLRRSQLVGAVSFGTAAISSNWTPIWDKTARSMDWPKGEP